MVNYSKEFSVLNAVTFTAAGLAQSIERLTAGGRGFDSRGLTKSSRS